MSQPSDEGALIDLPGSGELAENQAPRHGFQGDRGKLPDIRRAPLGLTISLTREAGARGSSIARRLGRQLGWQVYEQELIEYMAQDAGVAAGLTENLPPACLDWIDHRLSELRGSRPDSGLRAAPGDRASASEQSELNMARTILALAAQGEAILVGRGTGTILPRETTLSVHIIAPLHDRIAYMSQSLRLTTAEATQRVAARDENRAQARQTPFTSNPAEIHQYDLILNSSVLGEENCAELIAHAARLRWDNEQSGN